MYQKVLAPTLRALSEGDAEQAHELALRVIKVLQKDALIPLWIAWLCQAKKFDAPFELWGISFRNPIGIAAGLDKNAEMLPFLQALGPGHIEFGTVLPRPQVGNERPRVFRYLHEEAVINRLSFNSQGADAVYQNLREAGPDVHVPLFGSVGKMKDTPLADAADDYIMAMERIWPFIAVVVANISSPNTQGLRDLQGGRYLENFVSRLASAANICTIQHGGQRRPLVIKIAPDLSTRELPEVIEACERGGAEGLLIGNTTLDRPLQHPDAPEAESFVQETGGMSGHPIFSKMVRVVTEARKRTRLPIIAAGGIDSTERAQVLRDLGVDMVQVHTPIYFKGPRVIRDLKMAYC